MSMKLKEKISQLLVSNSIPCLTPSKHLSPFPPLGKSQSVLLLINWDSSLELSHAFWKKKHELHKSWMRPMETLCLCIGAGEVEFKDLLGTFCAGHKEVWAGSYFEAEPVDNKEKKKTQTESKVMRLFLTMVIIFRFVYVITNKIKQWTLLFKCKSRCKVHENCYAMVGLCS